MNRIALWAFFTAAALLVASAACTRQGDPSPDYEQGRQRFNELYGQKLEDAYVSPEMAPIEAQLEKVPKNSSDYVAARELLKRIQSGRERAETDEQARARAVEEAKKPAGDFEFTEDSSATADAGEPEGPDAGAPQPVPGMPAKELTSRWSDCFLPGMPLDVKGRGTRETFVLRSTTFCAQRHPGFDQKIVIIENDQVLFLGDKSKVEMVTTDAGVPPSPAPRANP